MNIAEYHVLTIIYRDGNQIREGLSKYIFNYFWAASPTKVQSFNQYENAIDSCLKKTFLKVLTAKDCSLDNERWLIDDNQNLDEEPYLPGNIDFTKYGARVYNDFLDSLSKKKGEDRFDGRICYKWKIKGTISILTKLKKDLISELEELEKNPSYLLSDGMEMINTGSPYPIGPWWVTRFDHIGNGWRVDIKYRE